MTATEPAATFEEGHISATGKRVRKTDKLGLWTTTCNRCVDFVDLAAKLECDGPCIRPRLSALGGISGQAHHVMPRWKDSGDMIRDIAISDLPYLEPGRATFDATLGPNGGVFWKHWRPDELVTNDLNERADYSWDWRTECPHWLRGLFGAAVYDPPFKNDGTPTAVTAHGLGRTAEVYTNERQATILDGMVNVADVLEPGGYLLVKCQAQQSDDKFQDQPFMVKTAALERGWTVVTQFYLQFRPRSQAHRGPQQSPGSNLSHTIVLQPNNGYDG